VPPSWQPGAIDLSSWSGQTVLIEAITDTLGASTDDFTSWGELAFGGAGSAACAASVPVSARSINVNAAGGTTPVAVTAGPNCDWAAYSPADWITVTPRTSSGSGTASVTIAPNAGPQRQSWVMVAGYTVAVSQAGAIQQSGPQISLASTIAGGATTRGWQASDFVNGQMPVQLDGVSATVNGKPAFVEYVSPTQINILTPLDSMQGTVQIAITSGGIKSAPLWIPMQTVAPGFFQFSGVPNVAATHATGNLLGPASLYPGASTPAQPGEVVTIYGGGFGQTTPPVASGSVTQSGNVAPSPVFTVSDIPAEVRFAGVVAAGLYQFNIVIPESAPNGDDAIKATYGGVTTQTGAVVSVQR
jgi:uncharacterized protein (TIGR03437 family)